MGKFGKYTKKYNCDWEKEIQFKGWLKCDATDHSRAYCKLCKVSLRAHKTDLLRHKNRVIHKNKEGILKQSETRSTLTHMGVNIVNKENKITELKLAVYIAVHSSIRSVDHLSELLISIGRNTQLENIKLHRTKCSLIIKNVVSPAIMTDLISDINQSYYSLIIDESTDISVCKYMAVCIRYFSINKSKIITEYLGIYEVTRATAEILSQSLIEFIEKLGLNIKRLIGLGTDGASNLCGRNHSVFTILSSHAPNLQLVKCVAHSLHLCSSKAADTLPASLDYLCRETYNWFACSPLRRSIYKETFNLINTGTPEHKQNQLIQLSATRWLSRANVIKVLITQWLELKTHFLAVVDKEKCYMARTLNQMFNDITLYLYLVFIQPILSNVNRVNLLFQSDHADIFFIYCDLYKLLLFLLRIIIKPIFLEGLQNFTSSNLKKINDILENPLSLLPTYAIDYGIQFRETVHENKISEINLEPVKERCKQFVLCLSKEMLIRIPTNINLFNSVQCFSPEICLNKLKQPKFEELPLSLLRKDADKSILEMEWKNLIYIDTQSLDCNNNNSEQFWILAFNIKDAGGNYIYRNIANFALMALSLPISNAVVERVFSCMNNVKTKVRNKMNMPMLDALLRIKIHFQVNQICCKQFVPSDLMIQKFNADMYDKTLTDDSNSVDETVTIFAECIN